MQVLHDYLLVKEVMEDSNIEGTNLKIKYDDTERFMVVEIVEASTTLDMEYTKYYPQISSQDANILVKTIYQKGTRLIINRVAKTPYKDGLYFISFKDIIAVEEIKHPVDEIGHYQMSLEDFI